MKLQEQLLVLLLKLTTLVHFESTYLKHNAKYEFFEKSLRNKPKSCTDFNFLLNCSSLKILKRMKQFAGKPSQKNKLRTSLIFFIYGNEASETK